MIIQANFNANEWRNLIIELNRIDNYLDRDYRDYERLVAPLRLEWRNSFVRRTRLLQRFFCVRLQLEHIQDVLAHALNDQGELTAALNNAIRALNVEQQNVLYRYNLANPGGFVAPPQAVAEFIHARAADGNFLFPEYHRMLAVYQNLRNELQERIEEMRHFQNIAPTLTEQHDQLRLRVLQLNRQLVFEVPELNERRGALQSRYEARQQQRARLLGRVRQMFFSFGRTRSAIINLVSNFNRVRGS